jgi:multidrug efflux system membrane fusion protein
MKHSSCAPPRAVAILALSAVMLVSTTGCARKKAQVQYPPAPVLAGEAVSKDVPVTVREIGTVEAFNTVAVASRVSGQLLHVNFTEGDDVDKGDLLFQIDPRPFQAALDQARGTLLRDQAQEANAESDLARYVELVKKDYVTKENYDAMAAAAEAAKATVKADEAAVEYALLNLEYCTIRSPIAGRTGNVLVKEGNLIAANSPNPLVTINQIVPVYVNFTIPEDRLGEVRRYHRAGTLGVHVHIPSDSTVEHQGKLTFIDNTVDERTGTILLKGTFPNEDRSLWPGQYVRVDLVLTMRRGATVIPASAVQTSQQGDYVYVIKSDDTAELRPVVPGQKLDDEIVIEKGVAPGERVVTDGQLRVFPGGKVAIRTGLLPAGVGAPPAPGGQAPATAPAGEKAGATPGSAARTGAADTTKKKPRGGGY